MPQDRHLPRLSWNNKEKGALLARAVELRRRTPTMTSLDALMHAQDVIAERRRKKKFTVHLRRVLLTRLSTLESKLAKGGTHTEDITPKVQHWPLPADAPVEPAPVELAPEVPPPEPAAPAPDPELSEEPLSPLVLLCREVGSVIGSALAREMGHLAPILMSALRETLAAQIAADTTLPETMIFDQYAGASTGAAKRRPRVAVAGLLPPQQQTMQHTFPQVDFRWLDHSSNGETVKSVTRACDEVYLMTKFIRHHTQNAVDRQKRVMVNGGVTDLTRIIAARYANGNGSGAH